MNQSRKKCIEEKLVSIPKHILLEHKYTYDEETSLPLSEYFKAGFEGKGKVDAFSLFPGISLFFVDLLTDQMELMHSAPDSVIEINYCRYGQIGWKMPCGESIYLGPDDFSVHSMGKCPNAVMLLPLGYYEGITICIDLLELKKNPPGILKESAMIGTLLQDRFCENGAFAAFPGDRQTDAIFASLFDLPDPIRPAYLKLKVQELLLYLYQIHHRAAPEIGIHKSEQIDTVKEIHDYLLENLDKRISIEELSKMFLMNTTTLKSLFKTVYGTSIAAHIKEHRMEKAASLLLETEDSIAEIARSVGYESQSKFTAAFKDLSGISPSVYRKTHKSTW